MRYLNRYLGITVIITHAFACSYDLGAIRDKARLKDSGADTEGKGGTKDTSGITYDDAGDTNNTSATNTGKAGTGGAGGSGGRVGASGADGGSGEAGGSDNQGGGGGGSSSAGGAGGRGAGDMQVGGSGAICQYSCCMDSDCPGLCQTCGLNHTCISVTDRDDPNHRCAGTCDSTGSCKSKLTQLCTATAGGCIAGSVCADGYCCDRACNDSCEACDVAGSLGTCTTLAFGSALRQGHPACVNTVDACAGRCNGNSPSCYYNQDPCGSPSCTGSTYQPSGTCNGGSCNYPSPQSCPNDWANATPQCSGGTCTHQCTAPYDNCDGVSSNGCEVNLNTDGANCGRCSNPCASNVCRNQACLTTARVGNTGAGTSSTPQNFSGNYLAGIQIYIPNPSVVTGFGATLFGSTASRNMYLGLYKDVAGNPTDLVAAAGPVLVSPGGREWNVESTFPDVAVGNYWLLGVWDEVAGFASNSSTNITWRYASYAFGVLPTKAPTSMSNTSLAPPNIYVIVAQ